MKKWAKIEDGTVVAVRSDTGDGKGLTVPEDWTAVIGAQMDEVDIDHTFNAQTDTYTPPPAQVPAADPPSLNEQVTTLTAQVTALQASIQTLLDR